MFDSLPLEEFADKTAALCSYLRFLLQGVAISLTPAAGSLLALSAASFARDWLLQRRVAVDVRQGQCIISLVPFYTSFVDVYRLAQHLKEMRPIIEVTREDGSWSGAIPNDYAFAAA